MTDKVVPLPAFLLNTTAAKNDSPLTSPPSVRFETTDAKIVTQGILVQVLSVLLLLAFLLIIPSPAAPPLGAARQHDGGNRGSCHRLCCQVGRSGASLISLLLFESKK